AWSLDVDLIERDHVAPEDHPLQVEATALGQEARHPLEEVPVDPLLTPGAGLLGRAEVPDAAGSAGKDEVEQWPRPASQVQHGRGGIAPDLLGHVLVLAPLCLLEGE